VWPTSPEAHAGVSERAARGMHQRTALLLVGVLLAGCQTGRNYTSAAGPRYAGGPPVAAATNRADAAALRLVSFNIEFALRVDSAIAVLTSDPALRGADVILLQEMDEESSKRIADRLGLWYVYYPAIFHFRTGRHFGNAVLSRWPVVEDKKIVLPHLARFARTQRAATAATIRVGQSLVRLYSIHLGTMAGLGPAARRDQLRVILADAARYPRVVIGGDFNDEGVGRIARDMGYTWPTERGPPTTRVGRLDHIFLKGLASPDSAAAGTVLDVRGSSDHLPVWAVGLLRPL
jgi:endonuclease/exonuclease/phosphatase family metal-dependent hydrolase